MQKAIILLSGGLDSTTALWSIKDTHEVYGLTFRYEKTNKREMRAAARLAKAANVKEHIIVEVGFLKDLGELMSDEELEKINLPDCYIPARNTIFFGIAAYFAEIKGAELIVTGHNSEDNFPDSSKEYFDAINKTLSIGSGRGKRGAKVTAPFLDMDKVQILHIAKRLKVPLNMTWSCHKDGNSPCGICTGCIAMQRALRGVGAETP
jgi:7-cyano-7-deazaguanine synthase